jgi:hypothetical protein
MINPRTMVQIGEYYVPEPRRPIAPNEAHLRQFTRGGVR